MTDADDPVAFQIESGAGSLGAVTVDPVTGQWTFTPTAEAGRGTMREVAFDIVAKVADSYYPVEVIAPINPFPQPAPTFTPVEVTHVSAWSQLNRCVYSTSVVSSLSPGGNSA